MKTDEQRIAIAQACPDIAYIAKTSYGIGTFWREKWLYDESGCEGAAYFDPLNDLNAMQAAVMTLTSEDDRDAYIREIQIVVAPHDEEPGGWTWAIANATAAEQARAFLEVKGLWTD